MPKRLLIEAACVAILLAGLGGVARASGAGRSTRAPTNAHGIVARRKRAAALEAERLLGQFVAPTGATLLRAAPAGTDGLLAGSGPQSPAEVVDRHRFWEVPESLAAVGSFVEAHRPPGFESFGVTTAQAPPSTTWSFAWPAARDRSPRRFLDITAVALPARTALRVDAKVVWTYPRSPSERVPPGTTEIDVAAPKVSAKVTDPAKIAQIVRSLDALPVSPPGIVLACPLLPGTDLTLSFEDASGDTIAQARVPTIRAGVCDPIRLTVRGRSGRPLVDAASGTSFVARLQALLGIRLTRPGR